MSELTSIYCDESCHLENDKQKVMLLGCIYADQSRVRRLSSELVHLKRQFASEGELKWTRVSHSRETFFHALVDWFFEQPDLSFRCIVVPDKTLLDHGKYNGGSHDTFYYKMYFSLLSKILDPSRKHDIYLDIKDTRSNLKVKKLHEILCRDKYDFTGQMIRRIQHVRSHEVELLQLADFFLGAVAYRHRSLSGSKAKESVINHIESKTQRSLLNITPLSEIRFNVFVWQPQRACGQGC
jgi:hypothetical protein